NSKTLKFFKTEEGLFNSRSPPNLIVSGNPGCGKKTIVKLLIKNYFNYIGKDTTQPVSKLLETSMGSSKKKPYQCLIQPSRFIMIDTRGLAIDKKIIMEISQTINNQMETYSIND